jgi:hypothetical protein
LSFHFYALLRIASARRDPKRRTRIALPNFQGAVPAIFRENEAYFSTDQDLCKSAGRIFPKNMRFFCEVGSKDGTCRGENGAVSEEADIMD